MYVSYTFYKKITPGGHSLFQRAHYFYLSYNFK